MRNPPLATACSTSILVAAMIRTSTRRVDGWLPTASMHCSCKKRSRLPDPPVAAPYLVENRCRHRRPYLAYLVVLCPGEGPLDGPNSSDWMS